MAHFGRSKLLFLAVAATALGACAENNYLYRPAQQATARVSGLPAARYEVPSEKPQGEVLVVSTGVTEIKPDNVPARALFARIIVSNNTDDATWNLDTRKQAAVFGDNRIPPKYVNTFGAPLPVVPIAKGEKRTLDFYFPLPPGVDTNGDLPQFDLSWDVETGSREVAERTSFDRFRVENYGGPYYYGYGWGYPYYYPYSRWGWYDPFWGPHVSVYYGGGWGYGHGGWYGGHGGPVGRPGYSAPSVHRR